MKKWAQAARTSFLIVAWIVVFTSLWYINSKFMFEQGAIWGIKQCGPDMKTSQEENPWLISEYL